MQWLAQGETVTVRVQGRWRRRRPGSGGQALLVLEALGQRHRFPAMPEPPSVTGAAPGTWQLSFSVPALLAPPHAERAWLQLGAVGVPLPMPVGLGTEPVEVPGDAEPAVTARRADADDALDSAHRRTAEVEQIAERLAASVSELEQSLEAARIEPARLTAALAELDRARRVAEQRAHAERAPAPRARAGARRARARGGRGPRRGAVRIPAARARARAGGAAARPGRR